MSGDAGVQRLSQAAQKMRGHGRELRSYANALRTNPKLPFGRVALIELMNIESPKTWPNTKYRYRLRKDLKSKKTPLPSTTRGGFTASHQDLQQESEHLSESATGYVQSAQRAAQQAEWQQNPEALPPKCRCPGALWKGSVGVEVD